MPRWNTGEVRTGIIARSPVGGRLVINSIGKYSKTGRGVVMSDSDIVKFDLHVDDKVLYNGRPYEVANICSKIPTKEIKEHLEYLRGEIVAERISTEDLVVLQSLAAHIDLRDVLLLEWTGVKGC